MSILVGCVTLPSGIFKKMDQQRRGVAKLERMLSELSLSEAAGGRPMETEVGTSEQGGD